MDKTLAGLAGAVGALAVASGAQAATRAPVSYNDALRADSYADLLKPIPNAMEILSAAQSDPALAEATAPAEPEVMQVQYWRHHHHHHHSYYRRYNRGYYHHHHHHHHRQVFLRAPGIVIR